jgi:hypothetical protein
MIVDFTVPQIASNHGLRIDLLRELLRDPRWEHDTVRDTVPLRLKDDLVSLCGLRFSRALESILNEKREFWRALDAVKGEGVSPESALLEEIEVEIKWRTARQLSLHAHS